LKDLNALWGGDTATAIETGCREPEIATVFLEAMINDLVVRFNLKSDPHGKIEVFRQFRQFQLDEQRGQTVPLPLIYADRLATGNDREAPISGNLAQLHALAIRRKHWCADSPFGPANGGPQGCEREKVPL